MQALRRLTTLAGLVTIAVLVVLIAALADLPPFGPPRPDTQAPDLLRVDSFRFSDAGAERTYVDFHFDSPVQLRQGGRRRFALVPLTGQESVGSLANTPQGDEEGDAVVAVAFSGRLPAADIARAAVSAGAVELDGGFPHANVLQTVDVSGGISAAPDLVEATVAQEGVVRARFDQPLGADVRTERFSVYGPSGRPVAAEKTRVRTDGCSCIVELDVPHDEVTGVTVEAGAVADAHHAALRNGPAERLVSG